MPSHPDPTRRALLIAAGSMTAVGALAATWPFIAALTPPADAPTGALKVDLTTIAEGEETKVAWQGEAVIVSRRTPEQVTSLRDSTMNLRDPLSELSEQPADAKNWHRSLRPEIGVFRATCTRGDCSVTRTRASNAFDLYRCPCCNATYDLAGRVTSGPAPRNLSIPPHRFRDERTLVVGVL